VYRAGYAKSRDMARQLVKHGHFTVNGQKVTSRLTGQGSRHRQVREESSDDPVRGGPGRRPAADRAAWLESIPSQMKILIHSLRRGSIDTQVQEQLIVELYSK